MNRVGHAGANPLMPDASVSGANPLVPDGWSGANPLVPDAPTVALLAPELQSIQNSAGMDDQL